GPGQPRPEHLTDLNHADLPEHHPPQPPSPTTWRHPSRKAAKPPARHAGWSHYWQPGGPILVAENPSEWSHDHGRRHTAGHRRPAHPLADAAGPSGHGRAHRAGRLG